MNRRNLEAMKAGFTKDELIEELEEIIDALTHEGRQGELEQANVTLADDNRKLRECLTGVRAMVNEQDCRGDEDCDHCMIVYHTIDPVLDPEAIALRNQANTEGV